MKILVLGSGAGGGFPQWNCNCGNCAGQRSGRVRARERTQSSLAVSGDGVSWVLLNASPDIGEQIRRHPPLHPRQGLRDSPIKAVVLMDAQIDHVTGLLGLREGPCIDLYATRCVFEDLTSGLPLLDVLQHYCGTRWHPLAIDGARTRFEFEIEAAPNLRFTALAIPGKAPPYSPHRREQVVGDNIALRIEDRADGSSLFYSPGLAQVGEDELAWMNAADCVLVDGTFWQHDEMQRAGLGGKTAADMGHLAQQGAPGRPGMLDALRDVRASRKVLIHINNSNPILDEDSAPRRMLDSLGIEVAHDGMEIQL